MPANLTPQYQKAEQEYRRAQSAAERLECLEQMLQLIPKHKGTEKLQADIKSKIKDARSEQQTEKQAKKSGPSYRIPRQGAGQIVLIGGPNSGKSRLVCELTAAEPEVADYPYTTREPSPGMMAWNDVQVQLIDTPPISDAMFEPYLLGMVRSADAVALCFNGASDDAPEETAAAIEQIESRKTRLSDRTGFDEDDFSIVHVKTRLIVTRATAQDVNDRLDFFQELTGRQFETSLVECDDPDSVEQLRDSLYRDLGVIRVYTKKPGRPAEYVDPFTIEAGGTVEDLAYQVHRDLAESVKHARVWGESARDGQTVGRDHQLADGDMVELHS